MTTRIESGHVYTETQITKFSADAETYLIRKLGRMPTLADFQAHNITPDEILDGPQPGNVLLTIGINQLWRRCATTDQVWDSTHGAIGVGDSTTAHNPSQTSLSASTNKYFRVWSGAPTVGSAGASTTTCIFSSIFDTSTGNFAWNEYGVLLPGTTTAYTSGTTHQSNYYMLNRKAGSGLLGTKTSAQTWTFTVTMTLA